MTEQMPLVFAHGLSFVKRRALQALRWGSALVHIDGNPSVITVPRGEEVASHLPWFRIKSQWWLDRLVHGVNNRERLMREYGKKMGVVEDRHMLERADLERRIEAELHRMRQCHNHDLIENRRVIDAILAEAESFHVVERDPEPFMDYGGDWPADPDADDIPF